MPKFLDDKGLQYLWSKIALEDYPNNETLVAIINAIDEEKLDKSIFEQYLGVNVATIEPRNDDVPTVFINGIIPTTKDEVLATLKYQSKTETFTAYITIKCQGTSSLAYPKKNFTIKLFSDEAREIKLKKNFRNWGEQNKFCLKANWIDISHARNIVAARLWGDVVKSRDNYDSYPEEFKTSPNVGAIDGFPIRVFCNGIYWGRYTWNIPKDGWMNNMDDSLSTHCILCGEDYASSCFRQEAVIDKTDWTDELHDEVPGNILTRWNEIISFVMTSSDDDFKNNLSNYFDVNSLIDYYCFSYGICHLDGLSKNQLFFTYDGQIWIASAYDMDSTFGLYWNGESFVSTTYRMQADYETGVNGTSNLLYDRLAALFSEEIAARWAILRGDPLSNYNVISRIEEFGNLTPPYLIAEDYAITTGNGNFTGIPSQYDNTIGQIRSYAINRLNYVDGQMGLAPDVESGTENILRTNFSPYADSWIDTANINWGNGDYVEASIDVSNCLYSNENILSIGDNINSWLQITAGFHLYYTASTNTLNVNYLTDSQYVQNNVSITDSTIIIKLSSNGLEINGTKWDELEKMASVQSAVQIGSAEGNTRSNAFYNYIKVVHG